MNGFRFSGRLVFRGLLFLGAVYWIVTGDFKQIVDHWGAESANSWVGGPLEGRWPDSTSGVFPMIYIFDSVKFLGAKDGRD